jgi:hypothetical protein
MIFAVLILMLLYMVIFLQKPARYIFAGILAGGLHLLFWPSMYKGYRLEKDGRHTTGVLLDKKCEIKKSQTVSYKFRVGSNEYAGRGKPGAGNQSCENFQIGDQIFITYLRSDPNINTPDREVDSDIFIGIFFAAGIFACLVWCNGKQARFLAEKKKKQKT